MHIGVITNPNSRKNRGRPARAAALRAAVGDLGEVHETPDVAAIKPVLRRFLRNRVPYWVADGGDGALHFMLKAGLELLEEPEFRAAGCTLPLALPTNGGTIDFVAHNAGIRGRAEELLISLREAIEHDLDIGQVEVDSMQVDGTLASGEAFRTYGFASAAGGIGQRFYAKYYDDADPNPRTIVKVVATTVASMPVALSPLRRLPGMPAPMRHYARDMFKPTRARVTLDGMVLPDVDFSGIHVASMAIDIGGVFRFFGRAEEAGQLHALVGCASPLTIVRNLPRMHLGKELRGREIIDRPCRTLSIEAQSDEMLAPIIDGEYYRDVREIHFQVGPRVRIPRLPATVGQRRGHRRSMFAREPRRAAV